MINVRLECLGLPEHGPRLQKNALKSATRCTDVMDGDVLVDFFTFAVAYTEVYVVSIGCKTTALLVENADVSARMSRTQVCDACHTE